MRVDKFLWAVRYYKTRSIATDAIKQGKIRINEAIVKPAREVYPGDKISVRKNQVNYQVEVLDLPKSRVGAKLVNLYINDVTPREEFEKLELLKYSQDYYRKRGTGRPTKKDRRELDDWFEPSNDQEDKPENS